jgi:hypothetical protein
MCAFVLALGLGRIARAAGDPVVFEAQINTDQISFGETVQLTIQVSLGDANAKPKPSTPDMPDFEVVSFTPQTSTQWLIDPVRGQQVKHVASFTYILRPKRKGALRIGEAKLPYGGRTYTTRPLTIHVGGSGPAVAPPRPLPELRQPTRVTGDEVFLDVGADKPKVYVGEQVTVSWYLYTQSEVLKYRTAVEPKTDGFWVEELYAPTQRLLYDRQMVRGKEYSVATLLKRALFPLSAGKLTVGPMESEVTTFSTAFYATGGTMKRTPPISIEVLPLPAGAPAGFDASNVGRFNLAATLDREHVAAGEPITLKVSVTGQGNLRNLKLRKLEAPEGFKLYEPKVSDQLTAGDVVQGTKTYEYLLVAQKGGDLYVPTIELSYFDPYEKRYLTTHTEKLKVTVVGEVGGGNANNSTENVLAPAIRNLRNTKSLHSRVGATLYRTRYFAPLLGFPAGLYVLLILVDKLRERMRRETPRARLRRARWRARRRFRAAEYHIRMNRPGAFYGEIARVINEHIEERLGTAVAGKTLGELRLFLIDRGFPVEVVDEIVKHLEACDFARFAPTASGPGEMRAAVRRTREILTQIEHVRVREEAA